MAVAMEETITPTRENTLNIAGKGFGSLFPVILNYILK
jgi:hypothetical protein